MDKQTDSPLNEGVSHHVTSTNYAIGLNHAYATSVSGEGDRTTEEDTQNASTHGDSYRNFNREVIELWNIVSFVFVCI